MVDSKPGSSEKKTKNAAVDEEGSGLFGFGINFLAVFEMNLN